MPNDRQEIKEGNFPQKRDFIACMARYEKQPWLRAVIQFVPLLGGPADTLIAGLATAKNQERINELFQSVTEKVSALEDNCLNKIFLGSDEFFEILRTCLESVARCADAKKRQHVADFLTGTIKLGTISDLSQQIAEDLKVLQPLHLQILNALPPESDCQVNPNLQPPGLKVMNLAIFQNGFADLERFGFIRFHDAGGGLNGGGGFWATTKYLMIFHQEVLGT